jgi:plastocyanin
MNRRRTIAYIALALIASHADCLAQGGAIGGAVTVAGAPAAAVVVYLVPSEASAPVAIAPITVEMDQRELHFVPHVIVASPGSTIAFTNSDRVMHNVFHPPKGGSAFDLGLFGPGERRGFVFDHEGAFVVFCHVHPEMVGYVVVLATPWRTTTDETGRFSFENVPAGSYVLRTWSSKLQEHSQQVSVAADQKAHLEIPLSRGDPTEPHAKPELRPAPR